MNKCLILFFLPFSLLYGVEATCSPQISLLILVHDESEVFQDLSSFVGEEGLIVNGVSVPGSIDDLNQYIAPYYYEKEINSKTIGDLKKAIYNYYKENGFPFIVVTSPPQKVSENILQLVVTESHVGQIDFVGNKWASTKNVKRYIRLRQGDQIDQKSLFKSIDFMNRNPFRSVNVIYSAGSKENTTDLTIDINAKKPYRFYFGTDNTGVPTTGRNRVFIGFNWDQMFGFDQLFSYQFITGYNTRKFQGHTFQYTSFLPNLMIWNVYGGYSTVRASVGTPSRSNKGKNIQLSTRLAAPFSPSPSRHQEIIIGFDWKNTNNLIEYLDLSFLPTYNNSVNLTQFVLGYKGSLNFSQADLSFGLEVFVSPGAWLPNQTNQDFSNLRPGAENIWGYWNGFVDYRQKLDPFIYHFFFRGQVATNTLLPSEELGIGGYGSVRGYDERQFNADGGFFINNELQFPSFSFFKTKKREDQFSFLIFVDAGWGSEYKKIAGITPKSYLIGIGPGARYFLSPNLTARLDLGFKAHHRKAFTGGSSMFHFSVIGSF